MSEEDLKAKIMNAGPAEFNKIGGIEIEEMVMPEGISFEPPIPAKVMGRWDGEYVLTVSDGEISAGGTSVDVTVTPDAMTIEDFYAGAERRALLKHFSVGDYADATEFLRNVAARKAPDAPPADGAALRCAASAAC